VLRRLASLALSAVALLAPACSSDGDEEGSGLDLPPNDKAVIAEMFEDELRPLELQLTRGALVDPQPRYRVSDTGRHLALYVEPMGQYTPAQYAEGIVATARIFLPEIFERWSDLETFDICQEPLRGVDDRKEPPPITQLYVTRAEARKIDWSTVGLRDLLAARQPPRESYTLYVQSGIEADPGFVAASQA
jgi:hypothetical protein